MGLVPIPEPSADKSVLFYNNDTEVPDFQFPESAKSITVDPIQSPVDPKIAEDFMKYYQNLVWKPLNEPLFQPDFETEFSNYTAKTLEWNKPLASLIGIIAEYPSIMQTFFP